MAKQFLMYLLAVTALLATSCAKVNLPVDVMGNSTDSKLFMVQSSGISTRYGVKFSNTSTQNDTIINAYSVAFGQGDVVEKDIPINFTVLPNTYIDAFNATQIPQLRAVPFPDGSINVATSAVIPKGSTQSAMLPVTIRTGMLNVGTNYAVAVQFSSPDPTYKIDTARNYAVLNFRTAPSYKGKLIGNIPQGADPNWNNGNDQYRPKIFDFFGDIMVRDRAGNLIIYPLESNDNPDRLGAPDTLFKPNPSTDYARFLVCFFNDFNNSLYVEGNSGITLNKLNKINVTPRTKTTKATMDMNAQGNPNLQLVGGTSYWYYNWFYFWMGYNGTFHGTTKGGTGSANAFVPTAPTTSVQMSRGINETLYQSWACADGAHIINNPEGLRIWGALPVTTSLNTMTITSGANFFSNYGYFVTIKKKDFIAIKKNGDVIRWKNFDKFGWYDGNDYDR